MTSDGNIPALCVFAWYPVPVPCAAAAALAAQMPDIIVGFDMVGEEWMPFGVEQSTYYYIDQYLQLPEVLLSMLPPTLLPTLLPALLPTLLALSYAAPVSEAFVGEPST